MVPAAVVVIDEFPLTPTGKLDREAIETLAGQPNPVGTMASSTPATPDQSAAGESASVAAMARRWATLLGVDAVDPDDDFFALGGHSLLAVELMTEIERATGFRPPLSALFDDRTPRRLAARLAPGGVDGDQPRGLGASGATQRSPVVVLRAGDGSQSPLWLMHPAGGNHLLYEPLAARMDPALPVLGVEAVGVHGEAAPLRRIDELADHQLRWMRTRQPHGPYRIVGYSVGGLIGLEVVRRLIEAGETVEYFGVVCGGAPGAAPTLANPGRVGAYLELLRAGDLRSVGNRFAENMSRRLEQSAVRRLGVRPSPRRVDENVRLAMVEAFSDYVGDPVDIAMELTMGLDNPDHVIDALMTAWAAWPRAASPCVECPAGTTPCSWRPQSMTSPPFCGPASVAPKRRRDQTAPARLESVAVPMRSSGHRRLRRCAADRHAHLSRPSGGQLLDTTRPSSRRTTSSAASPTSA